SNEREQPEREPAAGRVTCRAAAARRVARRILAVRIDLGVPVDLAETADVDERAAHAAGSALRRRRRIDRVRVAVARGDRGRCAAQGAAERLDERTTDDR